jgi:DNA topoisomerase-1
LETVTLEEALPLLALPRMVGTYNGESIIANNGRFGAYVQVKKKFVSLPPEITPFNVSESQAIELIVAKAAADAAAQLAVFEGPDGIIEVRKGRFGPYIKFNKGNFKIPKDIDAESLTLEASLKIIEEAPAKKLKRSTKKSSKKS